VASDGGWGPEEVVRLAKERGVETIAITDHDTMASVPGAVAAGKRLGVEVIPGLELTTSEGNHLLGYFVQPEDGCELSEYLKALRGNSLAYMHSVVGQMQRERGLDITAAQLEERTGGGIPNMSHLLDLLYLQGRLPSPKFDSPEAVEFFGDTNYLVNYFRAFARTNPFTDMVSAIGMIRDAGGAAVWAHPAYRAPVEPEYVAMLRQAGLSGLEVVSPKHDQPTRERLRSICGQLGLLPTGGTDYHGRYFESVEGGRQIGFCGVDPDLVSLLRGAAEELRQTG
jgi:predicted metal-dependent phosphoesterase TrpH